LLLGLSLFWLCLGFAYCWVCGGMGRGLVFGVQDFMSVSWLSFEFCFARCGFIHQSDERKHHKNCRDTTRASARVASYRFSPTRHRGVNPVSFPACLRTQ
jgi:hypothetical protein